MDSPADVFGRMNRLGREGVPFLFLIDFEMQQPFVCSLNEAADLGILYNFRDRTNVGGNLQEELPALHFEKFPVDYSTYLEAFEKVKLALVFGNSYLLNLTFSTPVNINRSLFQLFMQSRAPYRLLFGEQFTLFSPECFIRISDGMISSFPMKGTIDAGLPDAEALLLANAKELAEHHTIVDLIRNDLSQVAHEVRVKRFRYIEEVKTHHRHLLQASSEIQGKMPSDWADSVGDILKKLLPAGSISGAPKEKTIGIIRQAETGTRGYYTGVCGIFNGKSLDSAVMIRFIEQRNGRMFFRSGGGITVNSDPRSEYEEMIQKVYVPIV